MTAQVSSSKVSLIGEDERAYEAHISACPTLLLQVTDNSMDQAYNLWTEMLSQMEEQAALAGIDLKGSKLWINLFWEADGTIKQIAYYPKPNSKNMDYTQVGQFLRVFAENYILPQQYETCFSHYGSASFPVYIKPTTIDEK